MSNLVPNPTYEKPTALRGFENINRYWDKVHASWGAKILPGEYYVTIHDEIITTVLGSCVSACIRDKKLGVGGMNHFMLPASSDVDIVSAGSAAARYGNFAMEHLVNSILKAGGNRQNFEVKIFGGGKILTNMTDVGKKNIEFIRNYVKTENMTVISEDLGDLFPRKVMYHPASGKAFVKRLRSLHNDTVIERERTYMSDIAKKPDAGDVELF